MDPTTTAYVRVTVMVPGQPPVVVEMALDCMVHSCVQALPADHDFELAPWSQMRAREVRLDRDRLATQLSLRLKELILKCFKGRDPVRGYTPEQDEEFRRRRVG